jgi:hypothetical protein
MYQSKEFLICQIISMEENYSREETIQGRKLLIIRRF